MAHYLAELIQQAASEKSLPKKRKLQAECCKIIEDIWKKRSHFPGTTKPLGDLKRALKIISALQDEEEDHWSYRRFIPYEDNSIWGSYIRKVRRSMDDILAISLCTVLTLEALKKEKEWLKYPKKLSTIERKIIEKLDYLLTKSNSFIRVIFVTESQKNESKTDSDRLTKVFEKLSDLVAIQKEHLDELKRRVLPSKEGEA